jgi:hypothetical protein
MIKRTLILLIAVAGFSIANSKAEPVYGPFVDTWKDKLHHELGTQKARHLTEAARQWMTDAQARGYSEAECVGKLRDAFYAHHNTLPALPESKVATRIDGNQRIIAHGTMAAVGTASLESLAFALCSEGVGKVEQGEMIIKGLLAAGVAIDLNSGDTVTLRGGDRIPIHGMDSTVSGVNITYHGLDYIMIVMNDTFE